ARPRLSLRRLRARCRARLRRARGSARRRAPAGALRLVPAHPRELQLILITGARRRRPTNPSAAAAGSQTGMPAGTPPARHTAPTRIPPVARREAVAARAAAGLVVVSVTVPAPVVAGALSAATAFAAAARAGAGRPILRRVPLGKLGVDLLGVVGDRHARP